jgi:endonuclease YncB( thermonuclease family)
MTQPPLGLTARAVVDRVIDGDTLCLTISLPFCVRLRDCWAPEIHGAERPAGLVAKEQLERMAPVGSHVRVNIPTGDVNALGGILTFGRVLGDVWRDGDQESLSELMVGAGFATVDKVKP